MNKSKGMLESEISKALTQWEKDYLGRGSVMVKADIVRDMIIVTLKGVLTPAEYKLCVTAEGRLMIKNTRSNLVESGVETLRTIINEIVNIKVTSFHTDLSTKTGERVMVFKLENEIQFHI
ncbi:MULTISPECIES: DUF2294 domain-containing protein [Bacillus]|uniref:DUF2294 domain-containing protein n=1 Tax=Bacillus TaxID=1386 RepID=UPI000BB6B9F6|nr:MULTISPECIES: DUF2294 domain-containing protein [Bacillus]